VLPKLDEGPTCRFECDYDLFHPATHQQAAATTRGHVLTIGDEEDMSAYRESCCALVVTLTFWQRRSGWAGVMK